jgi:recombination protein RecR
MSKNTAMQSDLENLIKYLSKLPGLGNRSAKRLALHLLKNKTSLMLPLAESIYRTAENIKKCTECGNYDTAEICNICSDAKRDNSIICVVEDVADLWAMDRSGMYRGKYHVLGGTLSAMDGVGPEDLNIPKLLQRTKNEEVKEIILATNATVQGQTTAFYINDKLKDLGKNITRLAHGIPIGGELDFLDEGTLNTAMQARKAV